MGNLLKLIFGTGFNPLYLAIAAAVVFGIGAASGGVAGWKLNGWRLGATVERQAGKIATLTTLNATYKAANEQCATNVKDTKAALEKFYAAQDSLAKTVRAAMERATGQAAQHLRRAEDLLARPAVESAKWCATIMSEQGEAVKLRREERIKALEGAR